MKRLFATTLLACIASQVHAGCADRYYYYQAKPTVLKIKDWNVYQDLTLPTSKEIQDFVMMHNACSEPESGLRHNVSVYFNYIVEPDAWKKIKKPLYPNLTIRIPNGVVAGSKIDTMTITEREQKDRKAFSAVTTELEDGQSVSAIKVFIVRKGIDQMVTPQYIYSTNKLLQRDGYYFTEYKR